VTPAQRSALARRVRTDADQLAVLAAKVDAGAPPGKVVLLPPAA
jgi:hypothetical protein